MAFGFFRNASFDSALLAASLGLAMLLSAEPARAQKADVDLEHVSVHWSVMHGGFSSVTGQFRQINKVDMNFDRNMGASISSWMKGEPRYTPEGVFVVLLERGFHDLDSLMQVLGQFARVEGCEWAEKMQYAVSDRIERSAA